MFDPRLLRAVAGMLLIGLAVALIAACGGSAAGPSTAASVPVAPPASDPAPGGAGASVSPGGGAGAVASDGGGTGGNSAGDHAAGSVKAQVTGGLTTTIDLGFATQLALWETSGAGTAYLPFTDGDAVIFMTFANDALLVQYAVSSTGVGMSSGATPCTFTTDELSDSAAKGSFTCTGMTLIQGETLGSADMSGTFEAHK